MKKNRIQLSDSYTILKEKITNLNNKLMKNKKKEKILEGGVTSNSKVKFGINSITLFSKQDKNISKYTIKISVDENPPVEIEISDLNLKKKFKM